LTADFGLVSAFRADRMGNLMYNKTAQNFNPNMAATGTITVAEVEELGDIPTAQVDTPGIYVQRVMVGRKEKRIEKRTVQKVGKGMSN